VLGLWCWLRCFASAGLPDCRAYELVTPAHKSESSEDINPNNVQAVAGVDGDSVAFWSSLGVTFGTTPTASGSLSVFERTPDCTNLKFSPDFTVSTSAKTSRANGASLTTKLTFPSSPQGTQANIAKVKVPWLAERLEDAGVELAHVAIVGDRREDLRAALRFMAGAGMDVVITSGGLGPTADDLTTEVVAEVQGRELVWHTALQARIEAITAPFQRRWRGVDPEAMRAGARKQAMVPEGATVLAPVGTAPGLVVTPGAAAVGPRSRWDSCA
jgi:Probable molybdopterin binding domain